MSHHPAIELLSHDVHGLPFHPSCLYLNTPLVSLTQQGMHCPYPNVAMQSINSPEIVPRMELIRGPASVTWWCRSYQRKHPHCDVYFISYRLILPHSHSLCTNSEPSGLPKPVVQLINEIPSSSGPPEEIKAKQSGRTD